LARRRALYGYDDARVASARGDLAAALLVHGEVTEARRLLEASARPGVLADDQRGDMLSTLGRAYLLGGDLAAAERARREALVLARAPGARRAARTGDALDRLAAVLYLQGRLRESDRLLGEALPLLRPETHRTPVLWLRRGYARHHRGDLDGAARAYAAARSAGRRAMQTWAHDRARCGQALLLAERGHLSAARQALTGVPTDEEKPVSFEYREAGARCDSVAAWLDGDLARLRRTLARPAAAERAPVSAADGAARQLLLAELLLAHGLAAEALPLVEAAARTRDAHPDLLPWRRAEAHLLRGVALSRVGRSEDASAEVRRSVPVVAAALPRHRFLALAGQAS
jgi:tetratricopeptide (TPR) repeat protein